MANEPKNQELEELAFDIYSKRVASNAVRKDGEHEAIDSFRKAEAFLAVREKVRAGELKTPSAGSPILADCSAPNLKRTHPHNIVSQRFGNIDRVQKINAWLAKNPTPEGQDGADELVHRLNREFPDLSWGLQEVTTARLVFPAYAASSKN